MGEIIEARNTVAHGVFLGTDVEDKLVFRMLSRVDDPTIREEFHSYSIDLLLRAAEEAEGLIAAYEKGFPGIVERRAVRLAIIMAAHPKAPRRK